MPLYFFLVEGNSQLLNGVWGEVLSPHAGDINTPSRGEGARGGDNALHPTKISGTHSHLTGREPIAPENNRRYAK